MGPVAEYYERAMSLTQVTRKMNTEIEAYFMSKSQVSSRAADIKEKQRKYQEETLGS